MDIKEIQDIIFTAYNSIPFDGPREKTDGALPPVKEFAFFSGKTEDKNFYEKIGRRVRALEKQAVNLKSVSHLCWKGSNNSPVQRLFDSVKEQDHVAMDKDDVFYEREPLQVFEDRDGVDLIVYIRFGYKNWHKDLF